MIVKVLTKDNREYYSTVFAKINTGWNQQYIVFDDEKKFDLVRVYELTPSIIRKVFIIDNDTSNWIFKDKITVSSNTEYEKCGGLDWIINDLELFDLIINGNKLDESILKKAKQLNNKIIKKEWHEIKTQKDIENLFSAAWGFHDSHVQDIKFTNIIDNTYDPSKVQVCFTSCWNCDIILEFESDVLIHYISNDQAYNEFFDANILFEDDYIYWIGENIKSLAELKDYHIYFRGRSLKWKMIAGEG